MFRFYNLYFGVNELFDTGFPLFMKDKAMGENTCLLPNFGRDIKSCYCLPKACEKG